MKFEYKVIGTARKGKNDYYFTTESEKGPAKWHKCTEKVNHFLGAVKPCIITIDEQIDDQIYKVNLVKRLDSEPLNSKESRPLSPNDSGKGSSFGQSFKAEGSEIDILHNLLSYAESYIIERQSVWEKKKPDKFTKQSLESLNQRLNEVHKFMNDLEAQK